MFKNLYQNNVLILAFKNNTQIYLDFYFSKKKIIFYLNFTKNITNLKKISNVLR